MGNVPLPRRHGPGVTSLNPFPMMTRRNFLVSAGLAGLATCSGHPLAASDRTDVHVSTPSGRLLGVESEGVRIFRGVPFAEPPTGARRFLAPRELKPWQGERDATRFAAAAMQAAVPNFISISGLRAGLVPIRFLCGFMAVDSRVAAPSIRFATARRLPGRESSVCPLPIAWGCLASWIWSPCWENDIVEAPTMPCAI